jgi:hypothetical protein
VRARVPVMVSDEDATQLYNRVNGTTMTSIFSRELPAPSMTKPVAAAKPAEAAEKTEPQPAATETSSSDPKATRTFFGLFPSEKKKASTKTSTTKKK